MSDKNDSTKSVRSARNQKEGSDQEVGGLSAAKLRTLGARLMKLRDDSRIFHALETALEDDDDWRAVLVHLVLHDLVDAGKNAYVAIALERALCWAHNEGTDMAAELDAAERALVAMPSKVKFEETPLLPNLPIEVVHLAAFLSVKAPDRARAIYPNVSRNVQTALALSLALDEAALPEGAAKPLTRALTPWIGSYADTVHGPWEGREIDIEGLAARLGTEETLTKAAAKLLSGTDPSIDTTVGILPALRIVPKEAARKGLSSFLRRNGNPSQWKELRAALLERPDLEELVMELAEVNEGGSDSEKLLLFNLLDSVPEGVERSVWFSKLSTGDEFLVEYEQFLRTLGRTRALALAEHAFTLPKHRQDWVLLLHRVFGDEARPILLEAIQRGLLRYVGLVPEAALDVLETADLSDEERRKARLKIALGLGKAGQPIPSSLDNVLGESPGALCVVAGQLAEQRALRLLDQCMLAHPPEVVLESLARCPDAPEALRERGIQGFVERRKKVKRTVDARRALRDIPGAAELLERFIVGLDPSEKKLFGILEKAFDAETYAKLVEAAGGEAETRIQKFQRLSEAGGKTTLFFPAEGDLDALAVPSCSYAGGPAPAGVEAPRGREEAKQHVLSIDLSPFPDLVQEFGGETMSLFVEAPRSGEFNDDATLVCSAKLGSIPEGGRPLQVGALNLPAALRESGRKADQRELRGLLRPMDGHVFGPAYWIQESLGASVTLQLNDAYINLGDAGSLYIGDFGTTWQCS
ncbi:MAG: hypothetical protein ACRBN8_21555 [Nannocystales bacterium]